MIIHALQTVLHLYKKYLSDYNYSVYNNLFCLYSNVFFQAFYAEPSAFIGIKRTVSAITEVEII